MKGTQFHNSVRVFVVVIVVVNDDDGGGGGGGDDGDILVTLPSVWGGTPLVEMVPNETIGAENPDETAKR